MGLNGCRVACCKAASKSLKQDVVLCPASDFAHTLQVNDLLGAKVIAHNVIDVVPILAQTCIGQPHSKHRHATHATRLGDAV